MRQGHLRQYKSNDIFNLHLTTFKTARQDARSYCPTSGPGCKKDTAVLLLQRPSEKRAVRMFAVGNNLLPWFSQTNKHGLSRSKLSYMTWASSKYVVSILHNKQIPLCSRNSLVLFIHLAASDFINSMGRLIKNIFILKCQKLHPSRRIKIHEIENAACSIRMWFTNSLRYTRVIQDNSGPWEKYVTFFYSLFFILSLTSLLPWGIIWKSVVLRFFE